MKCKVAPQIKEESEMGGSHRRKKQQNQGRKKKDFTTKPANIKLSFVKTQTKNIQSFNVLATLSHGLPPKLG
jgi:hypothetical protein